MSTSKRKRQRTSGIHRTRGGLSLALVLPIALFAPTFVCTNYAAFFVTSFATGHWRGATTKLWAQNTESEKDPAIRIQDWIHSAIETTETTAIADVSTNSSNTHKNGVVAISEIRTRFFLVDTKHPGNVGSSARSLKTMGFFPEGLVVVSPHDSRVLGRKKCIDASSGATDVLEHALLVVDDSKTETKNNIDNHDNDFESHGGGDNTVLVQRPKATTTTSRCLKRALQQAFGTGPVLVCGTGMPVDMSHSRVSRRYLEPRKFFANLLGGTHNPLLDALNGEVDTNRGRLWQDTTKPDTDPTTVQALNVAFVFGNERYGMTPEDMDLCDVVLGIPTHPSFGSLNLATAVQIVAYDWRQALGGF